jgi:drug/metabolite transporter (DMT)-like permease
LSKFLIHIAIYTALAMAAFAANSVLCRLALGEQQIDAGSFTVIRLLSGAATFLFLLMFTDKNKPILEHGSWPASLMLFAYAITFSFAYLMLDTATGALILFGVVQLTMITSNLFTGIKMRLIEWLGVFLSLAGFVYLVLPQVSQPSIVGTCLMVLAGISWGMYTLFGKQSKDPLRDTASNFIRTLPLLVILAIASFSYIEMSALGVALAVVSGVFASALGYALWYKVLNHLTTIEASVVQLSVPVLAAIGGLVFSDEPISLRLMFASVLVLGGILLVVLNKPNQGSN